MQAINWRVAGVIVGFGLTIFLLINVLISLDRLTAAVHSSGECRTAEGAR